MAKDRVRTIPKQILRLVFLTGLFTFQSIGQDQSAAQNGEKSNRSPIQDYRIGPDDVVTVSVADAPEFGGKFRVSDGGLMNLTGLKEPIRAEGLSTSELSKAIEEALTDAKQLRNPRVSVFVDEYHGSTVTLLGAVTKPAVYSLQKRTNVVEALTLAGGMLPTAGNVVTVVRGEASAEATGTPIGSVQIVEMSKLLNGENQLSGLEVRNGDVISVSAAPVVYVVGAVIKPGGYAMADPSLGVSAVQAVALAQGFTSLANTHRAVIVRQSTNDKSRVEIPVDLGQMMAGRATDVALAPNDILFIADSNGKKTLKVMGEVALAAVNGVAYYGLGVRVGTK
jgi:polysaccharide export outer membrane protein